jgi:hypothetical protein
VQCPASPSAVCHSTLGRRMTVRGPDCGGAAAAAPPAFFATCVLVSMFSMSSRRRRPGCRTTRPMRPGSAAVVSRSPNGRLFARKMNTAVRRQGNQVCGGEHVAAGHDLAQVPAIAHLLVQGVSHSSGNPPKARCNSRCGTSNAGRISSRQCSSTDTIQSVGDREHGAPFRRTARDDLPHCTHMPPYRPNAGIFGLCAGRQNPHASRRVC